MMENLSDWRIGRASGQYCVHCCHYLSPLSVVSSFRYNPFLTRFHSAHHRQNVIQEQTLMNYVLMHFCTSILDQYIITSGLFFIVVCVCVFSEAAAMLRLLCLVLKVCCRTRFAEWNHDKFGVLLTWQPVLLLCQGVGIVVAPGVLTQAFLCTPLKLFLCCVCTPPPHTHFVPASLLKLTSGALWGMIVWTV